MEIIQLRLEGVPGGIVEQDAVQYASRKVAAVSGDARRALDICRRAVELAEIESLSNTSLLTTPRKKMGGDIVTQQASKRLSRVTIATIKRAISEATTNPLQQHLRDLPLSSKLLLTALLAKFRRTGLIESVLGEVIEEAKRIASMTVESESLRFLLTDVPSAATSSKSYAEAKRPPRIGAIGAAAIELMEAGVIAVEAKGGDRMGKIRMLVCEEDLKQAFKDDMETQSLGV
jgi:origin recognition complex subunit 1